MHSFRISLAVVLTLLFGGTAFAVDPVVTTSPATGITDLVATFNGTANPNQSSNGDLYVSFDYGTTTNYGLTVYPQFQELQGNASIAVTANATGLLPNATYHYRLQGYSNERNAFFYGPDQTFTTLPSSTPPTLGTTISEPTSQSCTIQVSSVTAGSSTTTVSIEYGLTSNYGTTVPYPSTFPASGSGQYFSILLPNLAPSTTYHYRCDATNAQGTVTTNDATFTTCPSPVVTTGGATTITDNTVTLNGSLSPGGQSLTVCFDIGTTTNYGYIAPSSPSVASGTGTYAFSGAAASALLPNTIYHYRLKAWDFTNTYFYGADATFTTNSLIESWRKQVFGTNLNVGLFADNASFSGDGVPNLLKYALEKNPTIPDAGGMPAPVLKTYAEGSFLSYTFSRDPSKKDLTYTVMVSTDAAGPWTTVASSVAGGVTTGAGLVAETPGSAGLINVEVRDIISAAFASSRYMRLQIMESTE